ncbi:MAG: hypothetical protein ACRD30_09460 [Bryobacteraceae bacterium]
MKILRISAALLCAAAASYAVETKFWQQNEMSDFDRGSLKRLSLSSDGRLTLAPQVKQIFDSPAPFLWAVSRDSKGNLWAGGGGLGGDKAKLFEIDSAGQSKIAAELDAMQIQALAIDPEDRVYAATSPDGKVYRINAAGKPEVFFDPHAKYIWALAFSKSGDLLVATGDQGEIFRVPPSGAGSVFFKTGEMHARSLVVDRDGNLIVGTDPGGLILRITPAGQGFVLYQAPKGEITAVAVAPDGSIYAAGVGTRQAPAPAPARAPAAAPAPAATPGAPATITLSVGPRTESPAPSRTAPISTIAGGSEIYRIQSDGYPRRIWSHSRALVYALGFDSQGRVLAGTGNRGAIYRIDSANSYTRLLDLAPTQITAFCSAPDGRIYAATGNIGTVVAIGPGLESSGVFESDIFDAGEFTYWGRLRGESKGGTVEFETRSGNLNRPQRDWSPWAKLNAGRIASPAARFLQYRATLANAAELNEVDLAYQTRNVAPEIDAIEITPPNYKFPAPVPFGISSKTPITLPSFGQRHTLSVSNDSGDNGTPSLTWAKEQIGARWRANDDNGDTLAFTVQIRGVNASAWQTLKENLQERYYSWDSSAFPDGEYVLKVVASDAPSNPAGDALTASIESDPFIIDNTPPEITGLAISPSGNGIELQFHAKDALSVIQKAEYSVNGGPWKIVDPVTRLSDSKEEDYRVLIARTAGDRAAGEMTVAVRVSDEFDNQAVAKTVFSAHP